MWGRWWKNVKRRKLSEKDSSWHAAPRRCRTYSILLNFSQIFASQRKQFVKKMFSRRKNQVWFNFLKKKNRSLKGMRKIPSRSRMLQKATRASHSADSQKGHHGPRRNDSFRSNTSGPPDRLSRAGSESPSRQGSERASRQGSESPVLSATPRDSPEVQPSSVETPHNSPKI